jgi:glycosyltransferase involved in cell wall biosynthesis
MNLKKSRVILYSFWFNPVAVAFGDLSKALGYCSIARAHGYDLYNSRSPIGQFPNRRNALNNLTAVFVASIEGSNYLKKMYPEYSKKIYSSRLGIFDLGNFLRKGIKEKYTFVSCSNLYDLKRVENILYLVRHLAQANRHLRFEWHHFGDGPEMTKLVSLCNSENNDNFNFHLHGYRENMEIRKWYAKNYVDFFVNYSTSEGGCPISIMEALNNGIPIIAPNVGGISEIVSDQNGILFDSKTNPIELAHRMQSFIEKSDAEINKYRTRSAAIFLDLCNAKKNYREFIEFILNQIFKY